MVGVNLRRDRRKKKSEEEDWLIKNRKRKENIERFREQNDGILLNISIPLLLFLIVPQFCWHVMMKGGAVGVGVTACHCLLLILILYTELRYSMNYEAITVNISDDERIS